MSKVLLIAGLLGLGACGGDDDLIVVTDMVLMPEDLELEEGQSQAITLDFLTENNGVIPGNTLRAKWAAINPNFATVSQDGVITGVLKGGTMITAQVDFAGDDRIAPYKGQGVVVVRVVRPGEGSDAGM